MKPNETNLPRETAKKKKRLSPARVIGRFFLLLLETLLLICIALYGVMYVLAKGPSETAQKKFVASVRETSAIGFLANLYFSDEEIAEIEKVEAAEDYAPTDTSLITINTDNTGAETDGQADAWGLVDEDGDGIIVEEVKGAGYAGYMMVVLDPSRVIMGTIPDSYNDRGYTVAEFVQHFGGVAGINAGGFDDPNGFGDGSVPDSVVASEGKIYYYDKGFGPYAGMAAIDADHILRVASYMSYNDMVDNQIQYAVCYGPVLINNGVAADPNSLIKSVNPRTAIGQRSDGAMLLLVIDGRQVASMGASYQDEVEIMQKYGAVNAVNLDGGSSSMMWYGDKYINNSSSVVGVRDIPTSFVVLPMEGGSSNG